MGGVVRVMRVGSIRGGGKHWSIGRAFALGLVVFVLLGGSALPVMALAKQPVRQTTGQTNPVGTPSASDAPIPVVFPRDEAPHQAATEWWYYTGHLFTEDDRRYGFEQVVFKVTVGGITGFLSHFAITDNARGRFAYDERSANPLGVSKPGPGFDLTLGDWSMRGVNGLDHLAATLPGYATSLTLTADKPAVLHGGDGFIVYAPGIASYYYSRTRMGVEGTLTVDGAELAVTGSAWMDHQWGDFGQLLEGGWDWFAVNLDDGTDVMLYVLRDAENTPVLHGGTVVEPDGMVRDLEDREIDVTATATWTSPDTGTVYPAAWDVRLPRFGYELALTPAMPQQELDTRRTTRVVYWEGEVTVEGTADGQSIAGLGYVELTGYTVGAAERDRTE